MAISFAQNIDLRSTFDAWAGTKLFEGVDGRGLVPLMSARAPKSHLEGASIPANLSAINAADG